MNISLKNASFKLKWKTATLITETEIQNKHSEKRKLKKELKQIRNILKRSLNLFILNAVFHQLNIALKSNCKSDCKPPLEETNKFTETTRKKDW